MSSAQSIDFPPAAALPRRSLVASYRRRFWLPEIAATGTWFDKVLDYMKRQGYFICRHWDCKNIVYLEGVNADGSLNNDAPNVFNDVRIIFSVAKDGKTPVRRISLPESTIVTLETIGRSSSDLFEGGGQDRVQSIQGVVGRHAPRLVAARPRGARSDSARGSL